MKKYLAIAFVTGIIVGFLLNQSEDTIQIKEVKGDPIKEVVYVPSPTIELANLDISTLPYYVFKEIVKVDTITNIAKIDTLAILKDYIAIKSYSYTLFNNEYGKLDLSQKTQYNSLVHTDYTYTPIKRVEQKLKKWQILVGAGYASNNYVGPSIGIIYKDIGVLGGYKHNFSEQKNVVDFSLMFRL